MKLSDYVIEYLNSKGTKYVFGMSGGAAVICLIQLPNIKVNSIFLLTNNQLRWRLMHIIEFLARLVHALLPAGQGQLTCLQVYAAPITILYPRLCLQDRLQLFIQGKRKVRQVGFQETDAKSIYCSITKYAEQLMILTK